MIKQWCYDSCYDRCYDSCYYDSGVMIMIFGRGPLLFGTLLGVFHDIRIKRDYKRRLRGDYVIKDLNECMYVTVGMLNGCS